LAGCSRKAVAIWPEVNGELSSGRDFPLRLVAFFALRKRGLR